MNSKTMQVKLDQHEYIAIDTTTWDVFLVTPKPKSPGENPCGSEVTPKGQLGLLERRVVQSRLQAAKGGA